MPTCTRYARTTRRQCAREAADWPGHRDAFGAPMTDRPDLPRVVACWSHLTDAERLRCQEARQRYNAESNALWAARREQEEQELAARRAAGIPDPEPVVYEPVEVQRCADGCISRDRKEGTSDVDSHAWTCANCGGYVCFVCGTTPVEDSFQFCPVCEEAATADWAAQDQTNALIDYTAAPTFRSDISALVTQIVKSGGPDYPQVQAILNRQMGIRHRGDATTDQLQVGWRYAQQWLDRLSASAPGPRVGSAAKIRVTGVVIEDGQILLLDQDADAGRSWSLPGGKVEHGEALVDALVREMREETGVDVEVGRLLYVCDHLPGGDTHVVHLTFEATRTGGALGEVLAGADTGAIRGGQFVDLTELTAHGFTDTFRDLALAGFPGAGSGSGVPSTPRPPRCPCT